MHRWDLLIAGIYMMVNFVGYLSIGSGLSILVSKRMRSTTETSLTMGTILTLAGMLIVFGAHLIITKVGVA